MQYVPPLYERIVDDDDQPDLGGSSGNKRKTKKQHPAELYDSHQNTPDL